MGIRMKQTGRVIAWVLLAGALPVLGLMAGCQTGEPQKSAAPAPTASSSQPTDVMTRSDAQRAEADLERQRREGQAERRPYDPGHDRVVDQPRVGGRR
jgi:hypothetical protein